MTFLITLLTHLSATAYSIPMKLAGKVALYKSYQAHKFWYELLSPLKSYFSFAANRTIFCTGSLQY